jgi:hypothetical protein
MFNQITMEDAEAMFKKGTHWAEMAVMNPNDPTSSEISAAINNYAACQVTLLTKAIGGLNEIGKRVDRIEQALNLLRPPGRAQP